MVRLLAASRKIATVTMAQGPPNCLACEYLTPYYSFAMPYGALEGWLTANEGALLLFVATCTLP